MELEGKITEVLSPASRDTGVAVFRLEDSEGVSTICRGVAPVILGDLIRLEGDWNETVRRFGKRFFFNAHWIKDPTGEAAVTAYLETISGIGPATAKKIYLTWGEECLEQLDADLGILRVLDGVSEKKIATIKADWEEKRARRELFLFAKTHGLSIGNLNRISAHFEGRDVKEILVMLRKDPFIIADIPGIGFRTADNLARAFGISLLNSVRIQKMILYVINSFVAGNGVIYCPKQALYEECLDLCDVKYEKRGTSIRILDQDGGKLLKAALTAHSKLLQQENLIVESGEYFIPAKLLSYEKAVFELCRKKHNLRATVICNETLKRLLNAATFKLEPLQEKAVRMALSSPICAVTGGAGTGKTTITRLIKDYLVKNGSKVFLVSPTGRAAKRLEECCEMEAFTIHRLLAKNQGQIIPADAVICDETSMVDLVLMHRLLSAFDLRTRFIFVGDPQQLPPVSPGHIFHDLLSTETVENVTLEKIHRSKTDFVLSNARNILEGKNIEFDEESFKLASIDPLSPESLGQMPFMNLELPGWKATFGSLPPGDPEKIKAAFLKYREKHSDAAYLINNAVMNPLVLKKTVYYSNELYRRGVDHVVLSPRRTGPLGVDVLNNEIQQVRNPINGHGRDFLNLQRGTFRLGDKVMVTKNNYEDDTMNGDVGEIVEINPIIQELTFKIDGRLITYGPARLEELTLAYAMTVHKSQGHEYAIVILPQSSSFYYMYSRNLVYTAVTRAKQKVLIIGEASFLQNAIHHLEKRHVPEV